MPERNHRRRRGNHDRHSGSGSGKPQRLKIFRGRWVGTAFFRRKSQGGMRHRSRKARNMHGCQTRKKTSETTVAGQGLGGERRWKRQRGRWWRKSNTQRDNSKLPRDREPIVNMRRDDRLPRRVRDRWRTQWRRAEVKENLEKFVKSYDSRTQWQPLQFPDDTESLVQVRDMWGRQEKR